jgi:hypothetical protein
VISIAQAANPDAQFARMRLLSKTSYPALNDRWTGP